MSQHLWKIIEALRNSLFIRDYASIVKFECGMKYWGFVFVDCIFYNYPWFFHVIFVLNNQSMIILFFSSLQKLLKLMFIGFMCNFIVDTLNLPVIIIQFILMFYRFSQALRYSQGFRLLCFFFSLLLEKKSLRRVRDFPWNKSKEVCVPWTLYIVLKYTPGNCLSEIALIFVTIYFLFHVNFSVLSLPLAIHMEIG